MNDKAATFLVAVLFYKVFPTILVRSCLEMVTNFYYGGKWWVGIPPTAGPRRYAAVGVPTNRNKENYISFNTQLLRIKK